MEILNKYKQKKYKNKKKKHKNLTSDYKVSQKQTKTNQELHNSKGRNIMVLSVFLIINLLYNIKPF